MKTIDSNSKRKVKIQLSVLFLGLAALGRMLWLHQEVTLPISAACQLRVLDETEKPFPNLAITHSWGRSLEWNGSDHKMTDASGAADFPAINLTMSHWERFKLRWMPATVWGWYPNRDQLPFTMTLPVNYAATFDPAEWRQIRSGDPFCFTNRQGVFVRYGGAFFQPQVAQVRNPILRVDPRRNTVGLSIPPEVSEVIVRVRNIDHEEDGVANERSH